MESSLDSSSGRAPPGRPAFLGKCCGWMKSICGRGMVSPPGCCHGCAAGCLLPRRRGGAGRVRSVGERHFVIVEDARDVLEPLHALADAVEVLLLEDEDGG